MPTMGALYFEAAWVLWLLPAPFALAWWFSRAIGAPTVPTGAVELWREAARLAPRTARRTWRWPPQVIALVAALVLALLALSQPRLTRAAAPRTWRAIVDVSAAMQLPGGPMASTRLERGLDQARAWFASVARPEDSVEWLVVADTAVLARTSEPPRSWANVDVARRNFAPPKWELFDADDTLWITDRIDSLAPFSAGLCASGGEAAPGAIASWPGGELVWDASAVASRAATRRPRVGLSSEARASDIGRFVSAWAAARGVDVVDPGDSLELVVGFAPETDATPAVGACDGWRVEGLAGVLRAFRDGDALRLADRDTPSRALVRSGRGWLDCAFTAEHHVRGDDAAFAVTWSGWLDAALLPCEPTATLAQRADAGRASLRAPARSSEPRSGEQPLTALLSALAAALASLALVSKR